MDKFAKTVLAAALTSASTVEPHGLGRTEQCWLLGDEAQHRLNISDLELLASVHNEGVESNVQN